MSEESDQCEAAPIRPATRGELRDLLKEGKRCEVAAHVAEMTAIMLEGWLGVSGFKATPSDNIGWVIFEPKGSS